MIRKTGAGALLILGLLFIFSCGTSRKTLVVEEGWELLGQQRVNFVRDKDAVDVTSDNKFTAIKFRVEDRAIRLQDVKIYFTNGDKLEPQMDTEVAPDQYSRDIELGQEGRTVDRVEFTYRTTGNVLKGRANLLVFGRRYDAWNPAR